MQISLGFVELPDDLSSLSSLKICLSVHINKSIRNEVLDSGQHLNNTHLIISMRFMLSICLRAS